MTKLEIPPLCKKVQLLKYIWHEFFSTRFGSIDEFSQQSNPKTAFPLQKCPKDWERVKDDNPSYLQQRKSFVIAAIFPQSFYILENNSTSYLSIWWQGRADSFEDKFACFEEKKNRFCKIIEVLKDTYIDKYFTPFVELKPTERRFLSYTLLRKI